MNWQLLDIRTGRANRKQFFLIALWSFSMIFLANSFNIQIFTSSISLIASYILMLAALRRLRDIKNNKSALIIFYLFVIFPYISLVLMLLPVAGNKIAYFWNMVFFVYIFVPFISAFMFLFTLFFYIFIMIKLFTKGNPEENENGLPPKGFDFNTMVTDAKYLKLKNIERAHEFLMQKDKEQFEQLNVIK